jgi:hypothetical protein
MKRRDKLVAAGTAFAITMIPISAESGMTHPESRSEQYQTVAAQIIALATSGAVNNGITRYTDDKPPHTAGIEIATGNNTHFGVSEQSASSLNSTSVESITVEKTGTTNAFSLIMLAANGSMNVYCQDTAGTNVSVIGDVVGNGTPNVLQHVDAEKTRSAAIALATLAVGAVNSVQTDPTALITKLGNPSDICAVLVPGQLAE